VWQFNAMGRINATPAEITGETRLDDQYGMKMQAMAALHWQYPEGNTPKRGFDEPLPRCRTLARLFATTTVRCILLNVMCVQVKAKTEWFPGRGIRGIPSPHHPITPSFERQTHSPGWPRGGNRQPWQPAGWQIGRQSGTRAGSERRI